MTKQPSLNTIRDQIAKLEKLIKLPNYQAALSSKLIGLEKESLRIFNNGELANTNHPKQLGSALTHPSITTDYAESQLELITRPHTNAKDALKELAETHSFIFHTLAPGQKLWPYSMPGKLPSPKDIMIAKYGPSVSAQFKEIYRTGLSYRYGKSMQLICGIHYNFSFSSEFWALYFENILGLSTWDKNNINTAYMGLLRNYMRFSWLTLYLFGASPVISSKLLNKDIAVANYLKPFQANSYLAEYGTSLRDSNNLGYHNKADIDLLINYNSIDSYASSLLAAISTPDDNYTKIGKFRRSKQIQISCNLLQIENEHYGKIRPKPDINTRELPVHKALKEHGISYVELRNIDLNPYEPNGITYEQCLFLEIFMYYCLLLDSPDFTAKERAKIKANNEKAALLGRQPNLQLYSSDGYISLVEAAEAILSDLMLIAQNFDTTLGSTEYSATINKFKLMLSNPDALPSAKLKQELIDKNIDYQSLILTLAGSHADYFKENYLNDLLIQHYSNLANESLKKAAIQEEKDKKSGLKIADFIAKYYQHLKD